MTLHERAQVSEHLSAIAREPIFRGSLEQIQTATDREVLLEGPAGTGKSFAHLHRLWADANRYPKSRTLLIRKTRASLTDTVLVTLENEIIPPGHPCLSGAARKNRHSYILPNGSEIVLGGMDKATRVLSSQYDRVAVCEATELTEDDFETLTTRMRNGVMPYRQIVADCNPDAPNHWLNLRAESGGMTRLKTRHEDNPAYHDGTDWTTLGREYVVESLGRLTGLRRMRYLEGLWAAAEGVIYEGWRSELNLVDAFNPPQEWRRVWAVDFGFTNPFVWQSWAIDPDGRMYLHREIYQTHRLVEDLAGMILDASAGDPRPEAIVCDHDAEDRATLARHLGLRTEGAYKAVASGIQAVGERIRVSGDGKPRLFIMRDALTHKVDPELSNRRAPLYTAQEVESYVWDTKPKDGTPKGDIPVKEHDHGMDTMRYAVAYVDRLDRRPQTKAPKATITRPRNLNAGYV